MQEARARNRRVELRCLCAAGSFNYLSFFVQRFVDTETTVNSSETSILSTRFGWVVALDPSPRETLISVIFFTTICSSMLYTFLLVLFHIIVLLWLNKFLSCNTTFQISWYMFVKLSLVVYFTDKSRTYIYKIWTLIRKFIKNNVQSHIPNSVSLDKPETIFKYLFAFILYVAFCA